MPSLEYFQTLIEQCTPLKGIGPHGFSDRRILSFVVTVYFLNYGFPTQTVQPHCSGTRGSSFNRNCTVLHAKPSTRLFGRTSWVSRHHSSLLPCTNVEGASAGSEENCGFRIADFGLKRGLRRRTQGARKNGRLFVHVPWCGKHGAWGGNFEFRNRKPARRVGVRRTNWEPARRVGVRRTI